MTPQPSNELPLTGIRVIDVATVIAAPYCASVLGEFGAEVLKVEHPVGGDACRHFGTPTRRGDTLTWLSEARNKKSVTIDLHHAEGRIARASHRKWRGLAVAPRSLKCPRKPQSPFPPGCGDYPMTDFKLPDEGEQRDD